MTHDEFRDEIVKLAGMYGWFAFWVYDSRRSPEGYPDLTLVRERVIWAELKTGSGRLTHAQRRWQAALQKAGQEVYLWRPADLQTIATILSRRTP